MPANSRPSGPRKAPPRPRRKAATTPPEERAPLPRPEAPAAPVQNSFPLGAAVIGALVLAGLLWWSHRHAAPAPVPAPTPAPAVQPTALPEPAPTALPTARPHHRRTQTKKRSHAKAGVHALALPSPPAGRLLPRLAGGRSQADAGTSATLHRYPAGSRLSLALNARRPLELACWGSATQPARLIIFGRRNHRVRVVEATAAGDGWVDLAWDGRDATGAPVAPGTYYALPSQNGPALIYTVRVRR